MGRTSKVNRRKVVLVGHSGQSRKQFLTEVIEYSEMIRSKVTTLAELTYWDNRVAKFEAKLAKLG